MKKITTILLLLCLSASWMQAQIVIGGKVYGGGNAGNTGGSTSMTVCAGDIHEVYGGARQADVGGSAFVHIDGEHASSYVVIDKVYGGNDIAGTIGRSETLPAELKNTEENKINTTWNAFVRLSTKTETTGSGKTAVTTEVEGAQKIYIGQLFAGGNGDYTYEKNDNDKYDVTVDGKTITDVLKPELAKTYLEICGGSIVYAYGGGNNVTVTDSTVIYMRNYSKVVNSIIDTTNPNANTDGELLTATRFKDQMGINIGFSYPSSADYQMGRLFGGNNKAPMDIRPKWNLQVGLVRNIYSGGNQGPMTHPKGILLTIASDSVEVDNVFGGCRMADVNPDKVPIGAETIDGVYYPAGYSARVYLTGGNINNVYGGNDISGNIYGGNAVGVHCSINKNVYGGGNGSYPYTDNDKLIDEYKDIYGDLYYTVPSGKTSVEALNAFRPNAESVSIRLSGEEGKPIYIGGAVYCGGNSATLRNDTPDQDAAATLKIGSYVYADKVFLGNDGENMTKYQAGDGANGGVLYTMKREDLTTDGSKFNSINLLDADQFSSYMSGVALDLMPRVAFDAKANNDPEDYVPYSTYIGSLYCGGNVGSLTKPGKISVDIKDKIIIFDKVVGGCNNAFVDATDYNALYKGGVIADADGNGDKLELSFSGMKIQPKRWKDPDDKTQGLIWNTISSATGEEVDFNPTTAAIGESTPADIDRRFKGGNIYGGCYNSGIVNGNVILNVNESINDLDGDYAIFDVVKEDSEGEAKLNEHDSYNITQRRSGVIRAEQGMDVLGAALNLFGGGYGERAEIWGSVTVNVNKGYIFQIYGGGERGAIGKGVWNETTSQYDYAYDSKYSTTINMKGTVPGVHKGMEGDSPDMAEAEFVYGGSFMGPIAGNTKINLGNCRVFDTFAGSCNADISGHTETYVGVDGGFPWVRDNVYGANDLGGRILGGTEAKKEDKNFKSRVHDDILAKVYKYNATTNPNPAHLYADTYVEYLQGRVDTIFAGCYGFYDYKDRYFEDFTYDNGYCKAGFTKPRSGHAFVNFRPVENNNQYNTVLKIHGAGQGYPLEMGQDSMQVSSYILADVPSSMTAFQNTDIFGGGAYGGVGMSKTPEEAAADLDAVSAIIDLIRGQFRNVYGGSFNEGMVRRSMVNVPEGSTIRVGNLFGGGFGIDKNIPCDVYESHVNYDSEDATVDGNIYGGNNNADRTLYALVNISKPVWQNKSSGYLATVYGAGLGEDTWAQYTEVNLLDGAKVYEVYGGGQNGKVINKEALDKWAVEIPDLDLSMHGYTENGLDNDLVHATELGGKYNTNVHIYEGATVVNYAYGGGLGDKNIPGSGDVTGTTYIDLLGGTVKKDLYAAGTTGNVYNALHIEDNVFKIPSGTGEGQFVASANAYIKGGTARNVYGGGWEGSVGYHEGAISAPTTNDIPGETHVIIGKTDGTSFINGLPAIERNGYGGGEGGAVFGTTNITMLNGFIGYRHFDTPEAMDADLDTLQVWSGTAPNIKIDYYQEKLNDETWTGDGTNRLYDSGCIFGGGYIDNSSVDITNVKMYGGHVRNALFGGGEIAAIGRGIINASGQDNSVRVLQGIYKAGKANVELYEGNVHRNVFGGGRGYNNLGEGGRLYSDGYVFGQTEVHIFGGTVGTAKELALENGNVFGGGDIGYVYSAYEEDGDLYVGIKDGDRYDDEWEGYYYAYKKGNNSYIPGTKPANDDPNWVKDQGEYVLTEDCKVLVEPHCKVLENVTINGHSYTAGQYITTEDLNTMSNKYSDADRWSKIDSTGIVIFNAVFAGGNTSSGSSAVYANTTTVFGNATASINDVYHRDFITLGTGRTGGLYGDGNLTFVDGYRGLNITNYGTDYYSISPEITIEQYKVLPDREAAYYQLKYKCIQECTDNDGTTYYPESTEHAKASTLTIDDLLSLFKGNDVILIDDVGGKKKPNPNYWMENGVCSIYAGRLMNTIQRSDFCGVFGSRMVMQGAQDRVPEIVDHTNYTINRVREVSLNQKHSVIDNDLALKPGKTEVTNFPDDQNPEDFADKDKAVHGNYFGIYNIVNYLGALTSDVHFMPGKDVRVTDNTDETTYKCESKAYSNGGTAVAAKDYGTASYYDWKAGFVNERKRNNGTSLNKVALASGVYLELTTEKVQGTDLGLYEKDWGYITGVIELDLINVQPGIGGGFVYAKNVHKVGTYSKKSHSTLTALNADAITRRDFTYNGNDVEWETSGNFVHGTQIIIDDCYNVSGKYVGTVEPGGAVPAHYWFIKGSVYVYDQYISAYTGAPNAYSESVEIPLTITAASHGTMKLLNVMPNKYAYYSAPGIVLQSGKKMVINEVEYHKNDPISYWDWYLLTKSEQNLFVDSTYVTTAECIVGEGSSAITFPADSVLLAGEYLDLKAANDSVYHTALEKKVPFDFVFRSSNNIGHDTGYMLTYRVNNPTDWNTWYTKAASTTAEKDQTGGTGYEDGPTYHLKNSSTGGVFGQQDYKESNIISKEIYDTYQNIVKYHSDDLPGGQASFENAFILTKEFDNGEVRLHVGSTVSNTRKNTLHMDEYVDSAYICTSTIQLSKTEFIYVGTRMTKAEKTAYYNQYKEGTDVEKQIAQEIQDLIIPAYYCTEDGKYGGDYYEAGKNYRGLAVLCSMTKEDREQFCFNYDAFDLLIDPNYSKDPTTGSIIHGEGHKYQYDSSAATEAAAIANQAGYSLKKPVNYTATYNGNETSTHNGVTLEHGTEYTRTEYESLPNEKRHYAPIEVKTANTTVYVVKYSFQIGNTPYAVGSTITESTYNSLGDTDKNCISTLTFTSPGTYYYCRESYKLGDYTGDDSYKKSITGLDISGAETGTYNVGDNVPVGIVIANGTYSDLINWQTGFTIHGIAPTETSTLYVSRESDIFNLSKEKIITVVYQYDYEESDESGAHVTPITERHVVNIHLQFKSGIPTVEDIKAPQIVLPGTFVGIREPHVTPGAYEVTGGGWKLFEKQSEAESHVNGIEYTPTFDPLYWYQDGYYLAYYAKTYLGETYSNTVQVSVANYHDLTKVLNDTEHHYYVDRQDVKRNSKIYITDATNGATQLNQFFDLSKSTLDEHVKNCQNLEFFLRTNVNHTGDWTPIGTDDDCFEGNLHGDGYHIDGLDKSLFYNLCGNVYNLGVTGSFSSAGIADKDDATKDKAYMENCWINTSATSGFNSKAILGTPAASTRQKVVNCYYPLSKVKTDQHPVGYTASDAITIPDSAFYNGTVAYNLNGFYLYKRYNNTKSGDGTAHTFYTINTDGTLSAPQTKNYVEQNATYCSSGISEAYDYGGYVEDRYADGDFRYANGVIPEGVEERLYIDANEKTHFYPIWPDDYIYFGQMLTYGWNSQRSHEDVPSRIVKSSGRLTTTDESNRVYRAPAYYQSKVMNVAHFNPSVNLVAYSKPQGANDNDLHAAYPNMTAIDFYGHNDTQWSLGRVPSTTPAGMDKFYLPLLDDCGLNSIANRDETPNLLVYAPTKEANAQTYGVLTEYFTEPAYDNYDADSYADHPEYRRVAAAPTSQVFGHLVYQGSEQLIATSDHLLVDKKDFNCPLRYTFDSGKRMWYQRVPDSYVSLTQGWETISLPFTAELVTTHQKGEITHFYSGSHTIEGSDAKIGHEYWLREYKGQKDGTNPQTDGFFTAAFNYPDAAGENKTVDNTFLWDYYYSKNHVEENQAGPDANSDTYQTYYHTGRTYEAYPLLATAKPYIVGFPGKTYYEFDLSNEWTAQNTAETAPARLEKQTISFVSVPEIEIGVSDDELSATVTDGYTFMPNYMSKVVKGYLMNEDGDKFVTTPTGGAKSTPFRPYFIAGAPSTPAPARRVAQSIVFDNEESSFAFDNDQDPSEGEVRGGLTFGVKRKTIVVTSSLRNEADVRIVNTAGQTIATFTIQPDETIETPVQTSGVYIVRAAGGHYTKKIIVK